MRWGVSALGVGSWGLVWVGLGSPVMGFILIRDGGGGEVWGGMLRGVGGWGVRGGEEGGGGN